MGGKDTGMPVHWEIDAEVDVVERLGVEGLPHPAPSGKCSAF